MEKEKSETKSMRQRLFWSLEIYLKII